MKVVFRVRVMVTGQAVELPDGERVVGAEHGAGLLGVVGERVKIVTMQELPD